MTLTYVVDVDRGDIMNNGQREGTRYFNQCLSKDYLLKVCLEAK